MVGETTMQGTHKICRTQKKSLFQSSVPCVPLGPTRTRRGKAAVRIAPRGTTAPPVRTAVRRARRGPTPPLTVAGVAPVVPPLSAPVWAAPHFVTTQTCVITRTGDTVVSLVQQDTLGMVWPARILMRYKRSPNYKYVVPVDQAYPKIVFFQPGPINFAYFYSQ